MRLTDAVTLKIQVLRLPSIILQLETTDKMLWRSRQSVEEAVLVTFVTQCMQVAAPKPPPKKGEANGHGAVPSWRCMILDAKRAKTYNSGDSLLVTHEATSQPVHCLYLAERTGSLIFSVLWSYVQV